MRRKTLDRGLFFAAIVGSLVLVNLLGFRLFGRLDLTHDDQFTLSEATRTTLAGLKDPVTVRAYFTRDLPPPLSDNARYVRDLLDEYYNASDGKLRYEFVDPTSEETQADKEKKKEVRRDIFGRAVREATSIEKELQSLGIPAKQVQVNADDKLEIKRAYMGLALSFGDKHEVIPVVQSTDGLEYDLTTLIRKLTRERKPKLAFVTADAPDAAPRPFSKAIGALSELYDVSPVNLASGAALGSDLDGIIVVGGTTPYPEAALHAIDAFVMQGHAAAFLLGPVVPDLKTLEGMPTADGLRPLVASYGVTLDSGLVLDAACATIQIAEQRGFMQIRQPVQYPFMPVVAALSPDHPVSRGIGNVVFPFTSPLTITVKPDAGIDAEVLARSSDRAWVQPPPFNLDPRQRWTLDGLGEPKARDLVATLSGPIPSHFAAAASTNMSEAPAPKVSSGARLVVAGGASFIEDQFLGQSNQALLLNLADWMVMDDALLAVRSRGLAAAPLADVSDRARKGVKYGNIVGVPLLLVLLGLLRWRLRERRRAVATV